MAGQHQPDERLLGQIFGLGGVSAEHHESTDETQRVVPVQLLDAQVSLSHLDLDRDGHCRDQLHGGADVRASRSGDVTSALHWPLPLVTREPPTGVSTNMPRTLLDESESIIIAAPLGVVRSQFGDVGHHQRTKPHRSTRFELLSETEAEVRYRQRSRQWAVRVTQHVTLVRAGDGSQCNTITSGRFRGGTLTFSFDEIDARNTQVTVTLRADLAGAEAILARLARRHLVKTLATALCEDRADIESGHYLG